MICIKSFIFFLFSSFFLLSHVPPFLLSFPSLFYLFSFLTTYARELPFYYHKFFFFFVLLFQQLLPIHFFFFLILRCYYLTPNLFNFLLCFYSIINYLSIITYHKFNLFNPKIHLNIIYTSLNKFYIIFIYLFMCQAFVFINFLILIYHSSIIFSS